MFSRKIIITVSVVGVLSFLFLAGYLLYSFRSDDEELFKKPAVSRQDALKFAEEFVKQFGLDAKNYPHKTIDYFNRNKEALYLLKIFGYKELKQFIADRKIPYAYWSLNWDGLKGESITVDISSQDLRVIAYEFYRAPSVKEKITNLKEEEAKTLAENFLVSQGLDLSALELLNINKNTQNIQEEYYFKWAKKDSKLGEAKYVINLSVKADKIASYSHDFELPESYSYEYENSQFISEFWMGITTLFTLLIAVTLIVMVIIRRKLLDWKLARRWSGILAAIFLVNFLNGQSEYVSFIDIIYKVIGALASSLIMFILIPITVNLFEDAFGKKIFITKEKSSVSSSVIFCYGLTFFSFILTIGVYDLLSRHHVTWDVGGGQILNEVLTSKVIYLTPFLLGIIPAFTEEFFRGFAMALSKKIFRRTFISILISAFVWGFAHTVLDGSFYPGYVVGIEKFISGIMAGYILLYFGIEVSICWHFLNNFLATAILLSLFGKSYAVYSIISSFLILTPFAVAIYLYFKKSNGLCVTSNS